MDASNGIDLSQMDLSKLTTSDKQELQQFMINESQKANIQTSKFPPHPFMHSPNLQTIALFTNIYIFLAVHTLTDICWTKCITRGISSGKLEKAEESCTQNCVERFMDANFTVLRHLETLRHQQGGL
jgi:mitochondrial import inner membrane translocase subunit TIM8